MVRSPFCLAISRKAFVLFGKAVPSTTEVGPEVVGNWVNASKVLDSTLPFGAVEVQDAESLNAVISTIGLPEEVADETVATEEAERCTWTN